jgi:hypothetical protein
MPEPLPCNGYSIWIKLSLETNSQTSLFLTIFFVITLPIFGNYRIERNCSELRKEFSRFFGAVISRFLTRNTILFT